jgi:hypothetical protein
MMEWYYNWGASQTPEQIKRIFALGAETNPETMRAAASFQDAAAGAITRLHERGTCNDPRDLSWPWLFRWFVQAGGFEAWSSDDVIEFFDEFMSSEVGRFEEFKGRLSKRICRAAIEDCRCGH